MERRVMQAASQSAFCYVAHGLRVAVNVPMPALLPAPASARPDLRLWLGPMDALRLRRPEVDFARPDAPAGILLWRQSTPQGQVIIQRVADPGLEMVAVFAAAGDIVEVGWRSDSPAPPDAVEFVIANYFMQAWLGMALRLAGHLVLHGNAVCAHGAALAWLGGKGAGKSTLMAACVSAGYPLLSDDQIVIWPQADGVGIAPGIMRLHLWPDSLPVMGHAQDIYPFDQPFPGIPKGFLAVTPPDAPCAPRALTPLRVIYVLQPRRADLTAPLIETPSAGAGFDLLYTHCVARRTMPLTPAERRVEFQAVGELYRRVPVRLLTLPDDLARLPDAVQLLVKDAAHG
jgi:hypothetical protein